MERKQEDRHNYKSMTTDFYQEDSPCKLSAELRSYGGTYGSMYKFQIWHVEQRKFIYTGNLQETIELILLGKLMKDKMVNSKVTIEEKAKATQEEPIAVIEEARYGDIDHC